jgi:type I protein arginine methyltransferase
VLDIGAGTGILSLLACKLGAGKVYAIEPSDALAIGIELARANGFADRIEFIQDSSFDVTLPHPADVMVSDLRGVLPLHGRHIASIADARRRLLAPGGIQIPQRDTIRLQLVCAPALHEERLKIWSEGLFGLDLSAALQWAAHQTRKADFSKAKLLGGPRSVIELDFRTIDAPNARGLAQWDISQDGIAHGLAAWFDTVLTEGVGFSNAPDQPRAIYGQLFLPFSEALTLRGGDRVSVTLAATLVAGEYVWQWDTTLSGSDGSTKRTLKQSTFQSAPVNPARLGSRESGFVPQLSAEGRAAIRALGLMSEGRSVEEIARALAAEFPDAFSAHPGRARELAGEVSEWFGEQTEHVRNR